MEVVGEVYSAKTTGKLGVEWKIRDFFSLEAEVNKGYVSPSFHFIDEVWCLMIYPNGSTNIEYVDSACVKTNTEGYTDVYLCKKLSVNPVLVTFSLGVKTVNQSWDLRRHYSYLFVLTRLEVGTIRLLKRSELLQNKSELAPANVLTIFCTIPSCENLEYPKATEVHKLEKLSQDLKASILSGDHSDTIIQVKGVEFRVHRIILSARSPYFEAMFKSDMKEKSSGTVSIDDCEPGVFRSFVHFLYTGMVDELDSEKVCGLYEVSDKYQEDQLKKECLEFMVNNISVDSFCDFSALASKYDEKELRQKSVEFFTSKGNEISRTIKWRYFMREYPMQANALIAETLDHFIK